MIKGALPNASVPFLTPEGYVRQEWYLLFQALLDRTGAGSGIDAATLAPLASPALTGVPTAPTAAPGTNTTQIATTAFVVASAGAGVTSFNTRHGAVTLTSTDVTGALSFVPYNVTNPAGYITASALTPYLTTSAAASTYLTISAATTTYQPLLGYIPYNSTNPAGYQTAAQVTVTLGAYLTTSAAASTYAPLASPTFTGTTTAAALNVNNDLTLAGDLVIGNNFVRHVGKTIQFGTPVLPYSDITLTVGEWSDPAGSRFSTYGALIDKGTFQAVNPAPYGGYNNAVAGSFIAGPLDPVAGFNGGLGTGVVGLAALSSIDRGGLFFGAQSSAAGIVLVNPTITATEIVLTTPLTTGEMAYLRPQMIVATNHVTGTGSKGWVAEITGYSSSGLRIQISGWTKLGSGDTTAGQVPSGALKSGTDVKVYINVGTAYWGGNSSCTLTSTSDNELGNNSGIVHEFDSVNFTGADSDSLYGITVQGLGFHRSTFSAVRGKWIGGWVVDQCRDFGYKYGDNEDDPTRATYGFWSTQTSGYPFLHQVAGVLKSAIGADGGASFTTLVVLALPSTAPVSGSKQLWYDPSDGNRVKFVP